MISIMTDWLVWNVALGGGLLTASCLFAVMIKSPVRRLRWLEWTLLAALLAPILATTTFPWKHSLHWLPAKTSTATVPVHLDAVSSESLVPKQNTTPVIHTTDGSVPYISLSPETVSQNAPQVRVSESNVSNHYSETNWAVVILSVQAAVMGLTVLWWGIGWGALRRLWRQGKPLKWGQLEVDCGPLAGNVELRSHARVNTPCAFGWWQWKILIPEEMAKASHRKQLRMACAHEWAHLSRGDLRTWRWTRFAQLALWMQPAYWWMRSQVRLCQDYLADSEAAASGGHTDFAAFLLSLARTQQTVPGTVLSLKGKKSDLTRRIRMLIESKGVMEKRCPKLLQGIVVLLVFCVLGGATLFQLGAQDQSNLTTALEEDSDVLKTSQQRAFHGRVVEHDTDQPIAGATVTVRRMITVDSGNRGVEKHVLQETSHTCDEQGHYTFEISENLYSLPEVFIQLDVSHPDFVDRKRFGWGMSVIERNAKLGDRPFYEKIKLQRGRKVVGQLLKPNGRPASQVPIEGTTYEHFGLPDVLVDGTQRNFGAWIHEMTDINGRFELTVLKKGVAIVGFQSEDHPTLLKGIELQTDDLGQLSLERGFMMEGRLLDAEGRPAKGVPVSVDRLQDMPEFEGYQSFIGAVPVKSNKAVSAADGMFRIRGMREDEYSFQIDQEVYPFDRSSKTYQGVFISGVRSVKNDRRVMVFKAHPTAYIHVRQTDPHGHSVRGQQVMISGNMGHFSNYRESFFVTAEPTEDGLSTLEVPKGLDALISTPISNFYSYQISLDPAEPNHKRGDARLGLIVDDISDIRIIHYKSPIVLVKVVDEQGINVPDITVSGLIRNLPQQHVTFDQQTDGRWRSVGMQTYLRTQIAASKEGYYDATQYVSDLVAEEVREITLVMKKK